MAGGLKWNVGFLADNRCRGGRRTVGMPRLERGKQGSSGNRFHA